jgi:hypothetical protein
MASSRVRVGVAGETNNAVIRFQRDSDDDGSYDDIDILAFALNVSNSTVTIDSCVIDGGTYGS